MFAHLCGRDTLLSLKITRTCLFPVQDDDRESGESAGEKMLEEESGHIDASTLSGTLAANRKSRLTGECSPPRDLDQSFQWGIV